MGSSLTILSCGCISLQMKFQTASGHTPKDGFTDPLETSVKSVCKTANEITPPEAAVSMDCRLEYVERDWPPIVYVLALRLRKVQTISLGFLLAWRIVVEDFFENHSKLFFLAVGFSVTLNT